MPCLLEKVAADGGIKVLHVVAYNLNLTGIVFQKGIDNAGFARIRSKAIISRSTLRINEIAEEFGFTDKSHFNRMFKKYRGMNPSAFKKIGGITKRH
jgi:AraC-like DNA-binding protein